MTLRLGLVLTDMARGGTPTRFATLARGARDRGHWVGIVSLLPRGAVLHELEMQGFPTFSLNIHDGRSALVGLFRLRRKLLEWNCAVVQSALWHANVLTRLACVRTRIAVVSGYQSVDLEKPRIRVMLDRLTTDLAECHVCASDAVAEIVSRRERVSRRDLTVARTGKEVQYRDDQMRLSMRERLNVPQNAHVVGWAGRMHPVKNLGLLLKALVRLPDWICVLLGEGQHRLQWERQASSLKVRDRVVFVGEVDDVTPYLHAFDVFCLPSLWEGSPGALIEAMAIGLPVVGSNVPGVADLLDDGRTGLLFELGEPVAVASAVEAALGRPELGRAAQRAVATSFSVAAMVDAYERAWEASRR